MRTFIILILISLFAIYRPELNKNVELVYQHNLLSILETAIRATNAQFEDKEILSRVSVTTLEPSAGEQGWDVFNMIYSTAGPLDTVSILGYTFLILHLCNFIYYIKSLENTC